MKLYTADDTATLWGISVQMVRRYCRENKVPGAVQTEQGWMIPEGTPKPGAQMVRETPPTPLVKKILYQHERNNHFGIYEYIQVNLAYSSRRMASNRLTRNQVEEMYRTKRLTASFEPTKVDDIVEMMNHFICVRYVIDNVTAPLTVSFIKQVHHFLTYGTYADQNHKTGVGEFRIKPHKLGVPPQQINKAVVDLIKIYERKAAKLDQILAVHVEFERIHPVDDYNGRVGRILMVKECLQYGIDPFIIDDKRRGEYNRGIAQWDNEPRGLTKSCLRGTETLSEQTGHLSVDAVSPAPEEIMEDIMEHYTYDKKNGLWYKLEGDYYVPCVTVPEVKLTGIWGERRRHFLKDYQKSIYIGMMLADTLETHLQEINTHAEQMFDRLVRTMAENENVTE